MHSYRALLINCMDPRLQGENQIKIAQAAGLKSGDYEVLTYAGPSLWMTRPHLPSDADSFWWLLQNVSLKVHGIKEAVLVGHSNCGGFALKGAPQNPKAEKQIIVVSLKSARQAVLAKHPELEVKLVFVEIGKHEGEGLPEIHTEITT
jgi:carbonic anhydrase